MNPRPTGDWGGSKYDMICSLVKLSLNACSSFVWAPMLRCVFISQVIERCKVFDKTWAKYRHTKQSSHLCGNDRGALASLMGLADMSSAWKMNPKNSRLNLLTLVFVQLMAFLFESKKNCCCFGIVLYLGSSGSMRLLALYLFCPFCVHLIA